MILESTRFVVNRWLHLDIKPDATKSSAVDATMRVLKITLWTGGITVLLENFGVNVTSIIAGVGIGGIAGDFLQKFPHIFTYFGVSVTHFVQWHFLFKQFSKMR